MKKIIINIAPAHAGKRLDIFLAEYAKEQELGLSRETIKKLILEGKVRINGRASLKPHQKLKNADEINLEIDEKGPCSLEPEKIPLEVIYEDIDLSVINKPAGLVVHPAPGNFAHTLVNALLHRFKELSDINPGRPGIVHRLDKETSGIMVIAKNNPAHLNLAEQFSAHTIKRKYIALVKGKVEFDENVIELPIGRHPRMRKNMAVSFDEKSRFAKTFYRTLKRSRSSSLLELEPFTGRTHQLRVHLAFLGHPIMGDAKYGKHNEFSRLALHAFYLGFKHPRSGKFMEFSSKIPEEFNSQTPFGQSAY